MTGNAMNEDTIIRLFSTCQQDGITEPFDLKKLPKLQFQNPKARQAYFTLIDRFTKWNDYCRRPSNSQKRSRSHLLPQVLNMIYSELQIMSNSSRVRQEATVLRLASLLEDYNVSARIPSQGRPKSNNHHLYNCDRPSQQKHPFYVRSLIPNLSSNISQRRLMVLEDSMNREATRKTWRKLRLYGGKMRVSENFSCDQSNKKLFRDWYLKEKCRQLYVDTNTDQKMRKSKKSYTDLTVTAYVTGDRSQKWAQLRKIKRKSRLFTMGDEQ